MSEELIKQVRNLLMKTSYDEYELAKELIALVQRNQDTETHELIKAVAHIGIDFGYGKFELEQSHIDAARKIYEASEAV